MLRPAHRAAHRRACCPRRTSHRFTCRRPPCQGPNALKLRDVVLRIKQGAETSSEAQIEAQLRALVRLHGGGGPAGRLSRGARSQGKPCAGPILPLQPMPVPPRPASHLQSEHAPEFLTLKPYGACGTPALWVNRRCNANAIMARLREVAEARRSSVGA